MGRSTTALMALPFVLTFASCGDAQPDAFTETGEIIAFGGGEAGAQRACVLCHGLSGQGDGALSPRLAGLDRGYLHRQLEDYVSGRRRHKEMGEIASRLSPETRAKVAQYYAGLALPPNQGNMRQSEDGRSLYEVGDAVRGLQACASCHGVDGEGSGSANPPLAIQPAAYLDEQLRAWKRGDRRNDAGHVMTEISLLLTESEIAAFSIYAASLRGLHRQAGSATSP
jgi:cytochrome c553